MIDFATALKSLAPDAAWSMAEDDYDNIVWYSDDIDKPAIDDIKAEQSRLQAEYDAKEYQRLRAAEYPPITDYIDGVVKGDQAQIDKYIADCLAVKAKYPKGAEQ